MFDGGLAEGAGDCNQSSRCSSPPATACGGALSECVVHMIPFCAWCGKAVAQQQLKVDVTADSCPRLGKNSHVLHLGDLRVDHTDG
jgi:hypothetical protein